MRTFALKRTNNEKISLNTHFIKPGIKLEVSRKVFCALKILIKRVIKKGKKDILMRKIKFKEKLKDGVVT